MNNNLIDKSKLIKIKKNEIEDPIWYKNINILFNKNRIDEYFPSSKMTLEEQINSIVRLTFYLSVMLIIYKKDINYIYILLITLLISYFVHINYKKKYISQENYTNITDYVEPTIDNPFMNIQLDDYIKHPNRESLNKINNYKNNLLETDINDKFNYNLYRDVSDIFGKNNSQRQFYTTPVTTIPNDQTSFANWLYKNKPTCKENNGEKCIQYNYNNLKQSSLFR